MDPVVTKTVSGLADPTVTAALVALAIALMEVIKTLVGWLGKRITGKENKQTLLVQLDPEVSKIVHETGDQVRGMNTIISRSDADGTPLVYADRKMERSVEKIAELLERVSTLQGKIAENMAKLEHRFEMHDRSDAVTFARIVDSQERLEELGQGNRESFLEIKQDHRQALNTLSEIRSIVGK